VLRAVESLKSEINSPHIQFRREGKLRASKSFDDIITIMSNLDDNLKLKCKRQKAQLLRRDRATHCGCDRWNCHKQHNCTKIPFEKTGDSWVSMKVTQGHQNCYIRCAVYHFLLVVWQFLYVTPFPRYYHAYSVHRKFVKLPVTFISHLVSVESWNYQPHVLSDSCDSCCISWGMGVRKALDRKSDLQGHW